NGMFYDPVKRKLIDYVGGQRDIERKRIRAIGDAQERMREDYLRMLRAVRFAGRLGFALEPRTRRAITASARLIKRVSAERVRDELQAILLDPSRAAGLRMMSDVGLLEHTLPEIEAMKGVEQGPDVHPEGDVFEHTLLCLEKLRRPDLALLLAALFHDTGKPRTMKWREGRIRFFHHESVGAEITAKICARLRLSRALSERVVWLVKRHMVFSQVREMRMSTQKKLFASPGFADVLELYRADALASGGKPAHYRYVVGKLREFQRVDQIKPKSLITGRDLIRMGYKPGPSFKSILDAVYDAQLEGEVTSKAEAKLLARKFAKKATG
ncbi:MAG: HD domain-containing protein, partial [Planctomycetia bacterium]|nr:HD domain-containing protein [Planctomycetia bacterium]